MVNSEEKIMGYGFRKIGESILRKEDERYIRGKGQYSDDLNKPNQIYAYFVRSQIAHGIITNINIERAKATPGVIDVLTGKDFQNDGLGPIIHRAIEASPEDWTKPMFDETDPVAIEFPQWPMPFDKVRHVGEPIAVVLAMTSMAAENAGELVVLEIEDLDPVVDIDAARAKNSPIISDFAPKNIVVHHLRGEQNKTDEALANSHLVVNGKFKIPRLISGQMEPRSGIAEFDPLSQQFIITAGNQGVHRYRDMIASSLKEDLDKVRVICPDVGGGFGSRGHVGPEYVVLAWAAKKLGRIIKWTSSRSEAFLSDWQGRDMELTGSLGFSETGKITAYKLLAHINIGAYTICYAPPSNLSRLVTTTYDIPFASLDMQVFLTNTVPVLPFRAAGRPETHLVLERLIDIAGKKLGINQKEIRLKNLISKASMPFSTPMGLTYDVGDYPKALEKLSDLMEYGSFEQRRLISEKEGKLRGISLVPFVESPVGAPIEMGRVEILANGKSTIFAGTQNHGQGHETTYPQVLSHLLGIPFEDISLAPGDTRLLKNGGGTHSDRSMRMMGKVLCEVSDQIIQKALPVAAHLLQVKEDKIKFLEGKFLIDGGDQQTNIQDVARVYQKFMSDDKPLMGEYFQKGRIKAFPYGASSAEIEIDPETGNLIIYRYGIVDDCGQAINPMIVHGQTHGGIVQGAGQALGECAYYDTKSGQLLTGSFMDYMMPRADQFPIFDIETIEEPSETNKLRIKAGGEAGTVPALAVIANAIMDALSSIGIEHFDMPYTSDKIWHAIDNKSKH